MYGSSSPRRRDALLQQKPDAAADLPVPVGVRALIRCASATALQPLRSSRDLLLRRGRSVALWSARFWIALLAAGIVILMLAASSFMTYLLLYHWMMPAQHASTLPVHFDVGNELVHPHARVQLRAERQWTYAAIGAGTATSGAAAADSALSPSSTGFINAIPAADIGSNGADSLPLYLSPGHEYHFFLDLSFPDSARNRAVGMISVETLVYGDADASSVPGGGGALLASSLQSFTPRYSSALVRWMRSWIFSLPLVLGWAKEEQSVTLQLFDGFREREQYPSGSVRILLKSPESWKFQLYQASLRIQVHLTGVRSWMYHWPLTSGLIGWGTIFCIQSFWTCVLLALALLWWAGSRGGDDAGDDGAQDHAAAAAAEQEDDNGEEAARRLHEQRLAEEEEQAAEAESRRRREAKKKLSAPSSQERKQLWSEVAASSSSNSSSGSGSGRRTGSSPSTSSSASSSATRLRTPSSSSASSSASVPPSVVPPRARGNVFGVPVKAEHEEPSPISALDAYTAALARASASSSALAAVRAAEEALAAEDAAEVDCVGAWSSPPVPSAPPAEEDDDDDDDGAEGSSGSGDGGSSGSTSDDSPGASSSFAEVEEVDCHMLRQRTHHAHAHASDQAVQQEGALYPPLHEGFLPSLHST